MPGSLPGLLTQTARVLSKKWKTAETNKGLGISVEGAVVHRNVLQEVGHMRAI